MLFASRLLRPLRSGFTAFFRRTASRVSQARYSAIPPGKRNSSGGGAAPLSWWPEMTIPTPAFKKASSRSLEACSRRISGEEGEGERRVEW